ncbi:MAG: type VI secretion system tube protein Hcp [Deltaproteobacteria bacterium]|nr:type VI secretion system tube protein Hcp [Deltaproteobacteria bacterium]
MPADMFINIKDIKGESTDDKHKEWIEVLSYNWGVSQMASGSQSTAGGGSTQRADFQDLSIVKALDSASPLLFKACASGQHIGEVKLELCRAGGDKLLYMEYKLTNVIISSVSVGGGGGDVPSESVTFNYGKIEQTYTKQKRADGKGGGNVPAGWDLEANKLV